MVDHYMTTAEVCDRLSVSIDKVQRLVASGELAGYKFGRCLRISLRSIEAYLRASRIKIDPEEGAADE